MGQVCLKIKKRKIIKENQKNLGGKHLFVWGIFPPCPVPCARVSGSTTTGGLGPEGRSHGPAAFTRCQSRCCCVWGTPTWGGVPKNTIPPGKPWKCDSGGNGQNKMNTLWERVRGYISVAFLLGVDGLERDGGSVFVFVFWHKAPGTALGPTNRPRNPTFKTLVCPPPLGRRKEKAWPPSAAGVAACGSTGHRGFLLWGSRGLDGVRLAAALDLSGTRKQAGKAPTKSWVEIFQKGIWMPSSQPTFPQTLKTTLFWTVFDPLMHKISGESYRPSPALLGCANFK